MALESFFDGNDDIGSIGCNLLEHPGIPLFCRVLTEVSARAAVSEVLVEVMETNHDDPGSWPFSERIFVIGSMTADQVRDRVAVLEPDEVEDEGLAETPHSGRVVSVWWD